MVRTIKKRTITKRPQSTRSGDHSPLFFFLARSISRSIPSTNRRPLDPPQRAHAIDAFEVLSLRASFSPGDSACRANQALIRIICFSSIAPLANLRAVLMPVPGTRSFPSCLYAARRDIGRERLYSIALCAMRCIS